MAKDLQSLPGFRDFRPEDCAVRNYLFQTFRAVAHRYGFSEYETPVLEPTELYAKKAGGELNSQLFRFEDQGKRDVTLRPEVTASLARLAGGLSLPRDYPLPLRWFEIGQCFRYERPQKGRGREFYQFNVDIIGEPSAAADAELIALSIDLMLDLGFQAGDFKVRLSDRNYWTGFAAAQGLDKDQAAELLQIVDKLEREKPDVSAEKLTTLGLTLDQVQKAITQPENLSPDLQSVIEDLKARGMDDFLEVDLSIVRGLAYYTGVVFELFDTSKNLRAIAGGGRYDTLFSAMTNGKNDQPACGFAIGDMVVRLLVEETPHANEKLQNWLSSNQPCDVYLVLADEEKRPEALRLLAELRRQGHSLQAPLRSAKIQKQFKAAQQSGAKYALTIGSEFPQLNLKDLAAREELTFPDPQALKDHLREVLPRI